MNQVKVASLLLMAGLVLYFIAGVVAPRLYQEPNINIRVEKVSNNPIRWNVSQVFFALGIMLPAIGFLLLAAQLRGTQRSWLVYLGAAAFMAGAMIGTLFVYRQTLDPAKYWESTGPIPLIVAYMVLTLTGLLFYGIAYLQNNFPGWLGYLIVGSSVIILAVFLIMRGGGAFVLSILIYIVAFVAGVVLWRL